jgi:hypothetical protein
MELTEQSFVAFAPARSPLIGFFLGDRLRLEAGVVGVVRADFHVDVTEDLAVAGC